jgi:hypothetical protein
LLNWTLRQNATTNTWLARHQALLHQLLYRFANGKPRNTKLLAELEFRG